MLPLLVAPDTPDAPAFNVVAVGLPGYGFSEAPKKSGFGPRQMAEVGLLSRLQNTPAHERRHNRLAISSCLLSDTMSTCAKAVTGATV